MKEVTIGGKEYEMTDEDWIRWEVYCDSIWDGIEEDEEKAIEWLNRREKK